MREAPLRLLPRREGRWCRMQALNAGTQVAKMAMSSSMVDQFRGETTFPGGVSRFRVGSMAAGWVGCGLTGDVWRMQ